MGKWPCSNGKLTSPLMSKNQGCACEANYLHQPARRIKLMRESPWLFNRGGIWFGKICVSVEFFFPWKEVEVIYGAPGPPYKIFFVRPVDSKLFFSRLSPMMRFTCRLSAMGGAPIALYQSFLDQPPEAILKQIQTHYKQDLQLHTAKKQPEKMLRSETGKQNIIL